MINAVLFTVLKMAVVAAWVVMAQAVFSLIFPFDLAQRMPGE
jgi:hypothetical protein